MPADYLKQSWCPPAGGVRGGRGEIMAIILPSPTCWLTPACSCFHRQLEREETGSPPLAGQQGVMNINWHEKLESDGGPPPFKHKCRPRQSQSFLWRRVRGKKRHTHETRQVPGQAESSRTCQIRVIRQEGPKIAGLCSIFELPSSAGAAFRKV